jgi:Uma2 family endonuclease
MSSQTKTRYTTEEYMAIDRQSDFKNEYFNGEIFAMTGASRKHNLITINVATSLNSQLRGRRCEVYASDMRVKVGLSGLYTYPDIVVVCGSPEFEDREIDTLINPTLIIEVLSKSTEGYDRGDKFGHYRKVESLLEYLLISQDRHHLEHYTRQSDNQWLLSETDNLQAIIQFPSINCELSLDNIYHKVEIES